MSRSPDNTRSSDGSAEQEVELATLDPSSYRSRSGSFTGSALTHAHTGEGLEWEILECVTDREEEVPREPTTNELSLVGMDWDEVTIRASVTLTDWAYDLVFPDEAPDGNSKGRLGVIYWCRQTILRESSDTVSVGSPVEREFDVTISREDVAQSVKIQPALVYEGSDTASSVGDYATFPGHRMAEGEVWTLKTDHPRSTRNLLHPETKKFSEDDELPSEDHITFVEFDRDPPVIYLNEDNERVIRALDSDSNRGWDAAVREVAYDAIEAELWPQLVLEAASDITEDEGPETPWKQGVLEKFREPLYGEDVAYEEALDLYRQDVTDPARLPRFVHDIDEATQTRNAPLDNLEKLLTLIDNR